jgi:dTDP-4-dehydrorhamnose reductase
VKVLVTGAKGQLGHDLFEELSKRGLECFGVDIDDFDITDKNAVREYLCRHRPDAIIHCAAIVNVELGEEKPGMIREVNFEGTCNIAETCVDINAAMMLISTDYVFGGEREGINETDSPTIPINQYGITKLEAEAAVKSLCRKYFIVRTSWVFGANGKNFVRTMLSLSDKTEEVSVVHDQIGSPTYTRDLSKLLCDMIQTDRYGLYHVTNEGFCSWAQFAAEIYIMSGRCTKVNYITSEEYSQKVIRPKNSRLSKDCLDRAGFSRLPSWQNALERYLKEINIIQ